MDSERWDRCIFLGDCLDDFGDSPDIARNTARWMRKTLHRKGVTMLLGNHDIPYMTNSKWHTVCPGWTPEKHISVNEVLKPHHWNRFKLWTWCQGWLLSHAGFSIYEDWTPQAHGMALADIRSLCDGPDSVKPRTTHTTAIGRARGGMNEIGGILWKDWDYEFRPIEGVNQLVGHTPHGEPQAKKATDGTLSVCLDTHTNHYAIIENGELEIFETSFFF